MFLAAPRTAMAVDKWLLRNPTPNDRDMFGIAFSSPKVGVQVGIWGAILRTSDGGETWTRIRPPLPRYDSLEAVQFPEPGIGYVVGSVGAFLRTKDEGLTWEYRWTGHHPSLHALHFVSRDVGYAAGDSGAVLKTVDGGNNWVRQTTGLSKPLRAIRFGNALEGCVLGQDSVLAYTRDGGQTWTAGRHAVGGMPRAIRMRDAKNGIAVLHARSYEKIGNHVLGTSDGGANWTVLYRDTSEMLAMDFFHPDSGVITGSRTFWTTADGGKTWSRSTSTHPAYARCLATLDARRWLAVSTFGEMFLTRNAGTDWTALNAGTRGYLGDIAFPSPTVGYATGQDGLMLKSTDAGRTWNRLVLPFKWTLWDMAFLDADYGILVGYGFSIFLTRDGGAHWDSIRTPTPVTGLMSAQFVNRSIGYVVDSYNAGLRTDDGGATWTHLARLPGTRFNYGLHFPAADTGFILGYASDGNSNHAAVTATLDGGKTWIDRSPGVAGYLNQAAFLDGKRGFVSGNLLLSGGVRAMMFKTLDCGTTWERIALPDSLSTPLHMQWADMDHGFYIAHTGIRYKTADGGKTWVQENTDLAGITSGASCRNPDHCFLVGPFSLYQWIPDGIPTDGVSIRRNAKESPHPTRRPASLLRWKLRYFDLLGRLLPLQP